MPPIGKEIHYATDRFGPIQVFDDGAQRWLSFGEEDEQSSMLKTDPCVPQYQYIRAMLLPLLYRRPRDAVMLGLGGGSLARFLWHHYPELTLRAVELRPAVIEIAHDYFQVPRDPRLEMIAQEGSAFLRSRDQRPTDLLLCDLYDAHGMDHRCFRPGFIRRAASLLNPEGWLVINCWEDHREDYVTLGTITSEFAEVYTCTVDTGNWIIFASRARNRLPQAELLARADAQTKKFGFPVRELLEGLYQVYPGFDEDDEEEEEL